MQNWQTRGNICLPEARVPPSPWLLVFNSLNSIFPVKSLLMNMMRKRFHFLHSIGTVLKFFAVVDLILATISLVVAPLTFSINDDLIRQFSFIGLQPGTGLLVGLLLGILIFIACAVSGILLFAVGELINVFLAIEENTRLQISDYLNK